MRVAVACGGTGGHIFPGLATAKELVCRGHDVTLWLAGRDVEVDSVRDWTGPVIALKAKGLGGGVFSKTCALAGMIITVTKALREMRKNRPDVVLAMGSYASIGPGIAAKCLQVPLVLHEGNTVPGRAVQLLAPFASVIGTGFASTRGLPDHKTVYCGFPVREEVAVVSAQLETPPLLLIVGGSQGAAILNRVVPEAIHALVSERGKMFQVVHLSGRREYEAVCTRYRGLESVVHVEAFSEEMPKLYACASLAIARSGAATCTELALARLPAILVPFAAATGNHQWHNAQAMTQKGGFILLDESACTPAKIMAYLQELLLESSRLQHMREALPGDVIANGASRLADVVEKSAT